MRIVYQCAFNPLFIINLVSCYVCVCVLGVSIPPKPYNSERVEEKRREITDEHKGCRLHEKGGVALAPRKGIR
jgi:hypothetical protein